jgi:hypothetical protein
MGAGTAGYCVGNLLLDESKLPHEDESAVYPESLAPPLQVCGGGGGGRGGAGACALPGDGALGGGQVMGHGSSAAARSRFPPLSFCTSSQPALQRHPAAAPTSSHRPHPPTPPSQILIDASNGASDYGNKFGEPLVAGYCRTFGQRLPNGERRVSAGAGGSGGRGPGWPCGEALTASDQCQRLFDGTSRLARAGPCLPPSHHPQTLTPPPVHLL